MGGNTFETVQYAGTGLGLQSSPLALISSVTNSTNRYHERHPIVKALVSRASLTFSTITSRDHVVTRTLRSSSTMPIFGLSNQKSPPKSPHFFCPIVAKCVKVTNHPIFLNQSQPSNAVLRSQSELTPKWGYKSFRVRGLRQWTVTGRVHTLVEVSTRGQNTLVSRLDYHF